jgi:hypothetical protein
MTTSLDRTRRRFEIKEAMAILSRTPAALDALLRGLPDAWTTAHEGGDTWSPFDVVGHLVYGERANFMTRTRVILEHGEARRFENFDRVAMLEASRGRTLASLLDEFASLRQENLAQLTALQLGADQLERRGTHPEFGAVTLQQLLATWVVHDLDHLVQVSRVLARQYTDAVGPWRAYLRVVRDVPSPV